MQQKKIRVFFNILIKYNQIVELFFIPNYIIYLLPPINLGIE